MSNGMSGCIQFIGNYEQDSRDRTRENKNTAFTNYINSYMESTKKKRCTCSACKTQNAIHPVKIVRVPQGVQEFWKCDKCGRIVPLEISNEELSYRLNVDKQPTTA